MYMHINFIHAVCTVQYVANHMAKEARLGDQCEDRGKMILITHKFCGPRPILAHSSKMIRFLSSNLIHMYYNYPNIYL